MHLSVCSSRFTESGPQSLNKCCRYYGTLLFQEELYRNCLSCKTSGTQATASESYVGCMGSIDLIGAAPDLRHVVSRHIVSRELITGLLPCYITLARYQKDAEWWCGTHLSVVNVIHPVTGNPSSSFPTQLPLSIQEGEPELLLAPRWRKNEEEQLLPWVNGKNFVNTEVRLLVTACALPEHWVRQNSWKSGNTVLG